MTEDEARSKWCPFVRITPETENRHAVTNRELRALDPTGPVVTNCIASDCMAWRSSETMPFRAKAEARFRATGERLSPGPQDITGYCGLAERRA